MSRALNSEAARPANGRNSAASKIVEGLVLAASPTFAGMALLTGIAEHDTAATLCLAGHATPLSGMTAMYLLMSLFHLPPWLKLTARGAHSQPMTGDRP